MAEIEENVPSRDEPITISLHLTYLIRANELLKCMPSLFHLSASVAAFAFIFTSNHLVLTTEDSPERAVTDTSGRYLAKKYCQSCHLFPEPELLDKQTWAKGVLPYMGLRLGIKSHINPYHGLFAEEKQRLQEAGIYPEKALLTKAEWRAIVNYYVNAAPERTLQPLKVPTAQKNLPLFEVKEISWQNEHLPQTTLLRYDTLSSRFYVADRQKQVTILKSNFEVERVISLDSPASAMRVSKEEDVQVLTTGTLNPSDLSIGNLLKINADDKIEVQLHSLPRPVDFVECDLNQDGKKDVVVCGFGHNLGKLLWIESYRESHSQEHVLRALPGARTAVVKDFNEDGRPDIMVLMEQAQEGIFLYENQGNGHFLEREKLRFPPVYGTSSMQVVDYNQDGFDDLLITNGDNWDYTNILKAYHGVRVYLNDGKNNFKEALFYPLYGANQAIAADFDGDGDLDIAAISFFPDLLNSPEKGFIYLENEGNMQVKAYTTPEAASGKWLVMEVADYDQDGDLDIMLGSHVSNMLDFTTLTLQGKQTFPQILLLTNQRGAQ